MNAIRRTLPSTRHVLRTSMPRMQCRAAHDAHHDAHGAHSHTPIKESFGTGFYIVLALLPASYGLYQIATPGNNDIPVLTNWINTYSNWKQDWVDRNDLHTKLIQRAADDRNLFFSSTSPRHVDLRFPEVFNTGSPYNVPAGSVANIDKVIAHYEKKNYEAQAKQLEVDKERT